MIKTTTLILLASSLGFVSPQKAPVKPLKTGLYYIVDKPNIFKRQLDKTKEVYFLDPTPIVTVKQFAKIAIEKDNIRHTDAVRIKLNNAGTAAFSLATKGYINKKIAIIIDDQLIIAPTVQTQIPSGIIGINRADYSEKEISRFAKIIKAEMK